LKQAELDRRSTAPAADRAEARYWRFTARKAGLLVGDDPSADAVLEQAVGVAALIGADGSSWVTELVRRVLLLAGADKARIAACASWLAGLYPGDAGMGSAVAREARPICVPF
jgi:hypothetical protein